MSGIAFNEDSSHYFISRAGQKLDAQKVASWVDQYADTQVAEMMLNPNAMRTSHDSKVWDPIWRGYDPEGPDDQPLLAGSSPEERTSARKFIHTAWQLNHDGIDVYRIWIERCRKRKISPWISMRMNDVHYADNEKSFIQGELWRRRPDLRRVTYRSGGWDENAFDYGKAEVREYHMALIRELAERYDFDGFELDWMRFRHHFRPGYEAEGTPLLTEFTAEVRRLLDQWERKRGHRIRLGARVASRPQTALGFGMDAATWARRGLIDMLVVCPHWNSVEPDMPIELWKQLLEGTKVTLAAGLEILVSPSVDHPLGPNTLNTLETVRGAAAALLDRGVDRIYLFNYMDMDIDIMGLGDIKDYQAMFREIGDLRTLAGKSRRHILTFADVWAPGEPPAALLPCACKAGKFQTFRLPTGPVPSGGEVTAIFGIKGDATITSNSMEVRLNGELCSFTGAVQLARPKPVFPVYGYQVPVSAMKRGYNVIEVVPGIDLTIGWVEISVRYS